MSELYAVIYVGCMECGVPTELVGIYTNRDAAHAAVTVIDAGGDSWARHGGDGYVEVFGPVEVGSTTDPGKYEPSS